MDTTISMGRGNKNKKIEEVILHSAETFQKMALGFMPGGHVIDEFLNARSNLKQKRVLNFAERLSDFFKEVNQDEIDEESYTSDHFIDIFESVISKVHLTSSEIKLEYFRNIVVNQITEASANDILANKIIQTVDELNDLQLLLLMIVWEKGHLNIYDLHMEFRMKNVYIRLDKKDELPQDIKMDQVLESSIFLYFIDELITKGLLDHLEIDGEAIAPLRELKLAYKGYTNSKRSLSNSKIVFQCSSYGALLCGFIHNDS